MTARLSVPPGTAGLGFVGGRVGPRVRGSHLPCFVSRSLATLNQFSQQFFFPSGNNFTAVSFSAADISPKPLHASVCL